MAGRLMGSVLYAGFDLPVRVLKLLWREEAGQDLVEYGLLAVLLSLAAMTAMTGLGSAISSVFSGAAANVTSLS
jgi:pilus assembly protein Flp/PilA